jgi:hypothetical protein
MVSWEFNVLFGTPLALLFPEVNPPGLADLHRAHKLKRRDVESFGEHSL